ncbi:RNA polymerase subunit sigma-24 [Cellulomonas sp. WB94]|nr:RNA polymerase subunit sigma-24 [Cellulomonas sp. WB94]
MSDWEHVLDALVRERGPALVRYAALLTGNLGDADDLVQEALVRSFSQGRPLRQTLAAESYVRRAILSIFLDGYRRRRRWAGVRHLLARLDDAEGGGPAPLRPARRIPRRRADHRRTAPRGEAARRHDRLGVDRDGGCRRCRRSDPRDRRPGLLAGVGRLHTARGPDARRPVAGQGHGQSHERRRGHGRLPDQPELSSRQVSLRAPRRASRGS